MLNRLIKYTDILILICISIVLDIYVLRSSLTIGLVQSADWPIPILSVKELYEFVLPAWSFQDMAPSGLNIFLAIYGLSASLLHNPSIIQKLFYFIPWSLSPISAFLLLRKIGVGRYTSISLSILYQYGPWINGQFMDGEPGNVMLYLFIPVILYILFRYFDDPKRLIIYLTLAMMIPSFFTLESPFFYVFLIFPVFMYLIFLGRMRDGLKLIFSSAISFIVIVVFNIYSITPYVSGFLTVSSDTNSLISSFTQFPPAVIARYWMIAFLAVSWVSVYYVKRVKENDDWKKIFWFSVVSSLLVIIYPGLGITVMGAYLLSHFPLLAPFINPSEFLLYTWVTLFLAVSYCLKPGVMVQYHRKGGRVKYTFRHLKHPAFAVAVIGLALLLLSSSVVEIQSFGSHDTGIYLFTQGTHFQKTEVQPQYIDLYDFLNSHNASFGLSYHTIIFPENPNYTLPYYIGQQMIPGYIGLFNRSSADQMINGINGNNSDFLMMLSVMGVKYLAVIDVPGSTWSGTHGPPQLSMWGSKYIFVGNYSSYLRDLKRLSDLKMVQHSPGLWIFQNLYYQSPALSAKSQYYSDTYNQNYLALYNTTPISSNIVRENDFHYSGSNFSVMSNLSFSICRNSSRVYAYSYLSLFPNSSYLFSFNFNTTGTLKTYYGNGQNAGMALFNVSSSYEDIIGGTVITINPEAFANGTYKSMFRTPDFKKPLSAEVIFQLQPPVQHNSIKVSVSNISIVKVNGSNMFFDLFKPIPIKETGPTSFTLGNIERGRQISIDQTFGSGWVLSGGNSTIKEGVPGAFYQISFDPSFSGNATLTYDAQSHYTTLLYISFGSIVVFMVSVAVLTASRRLRV